MSNNKAVKGKTFTSLTQWHTNLFIPLFTEAGVWVKHEL